MFHTATTKVRRAFAVVRFGLLILRWCGPRLFLRKMAHQIYGRTIFLVTKGPLDEPKLPSSFQCTVSLASPADVEELFSRLHHESPEGRYQLLVRKWYHERGLGDCYITRAADTNEICMVRWLITPEHVKRLGWEDRFPLEEDEYTSENIYTFKRYRRVGAGKASSILMTEIIRQLGFKRYKCYTDETNILTLKWSERAGDKVYERILERHFLFRVTRKTLAIYAPPIPMKAPQDS